ncbi:hypothetical protein EHM69_01105 [candidate division KSB1 bacterium]|nr:MAG: hypothetical protein EHM69_01105 [candidate division KSB1 bacterium]
MRKFLVLFLLTALAAAAYSEPLFPDPLIGSRPGAFTARGLSLGHCYLTSETGPSALMGNPAAIAFDRKKVRFEVSADLSRVKETRKYPVYDAFDAVLGYNNYAINDHLFSKLDGGAAIVLPPVGNQNFVFSLGTYSAYRFDYRYREEVRDRYSQGGIQDRRLGENKLDVSGDLRSATFGAAWENHGVALGLSWSGLTGDWNYAKGTYYADTTKANLVDHIEFSPDGMPAEFNLGAIWQINDRVMVGGRALMPAGDYKIEQKVTVEEGAASSSHSSTMTVKYPKHYSLGVQYKPQNEFRPMLMLEGEIHTYSDVADFYDNTFEIRAGAEQQVVPGAPVRIGYVYSTSPEDKDRASSFFTAGIGFHIQKLSGDVGMEMGRINYTSSDLFPQELFGGTNRRDKDQVEVGVFRAMLTLGYEL